jgi:hypothetical protein
VTNKKKVNKKLHMILTGLNEEINLDAEQREVSDDSERRNRGWCKRLGTH